MENEELWPIVCRWEANLSWEATELWFVKINYHLCFYFSIKMATIEARSWAYRRTVAKFKGKLLTNYAFWVKMILHILNSNYYYFLSSHILIHWQYCVAQFLVNFLRFELIRYNWRGRGIYLNFDLECVHFV